MMGVYCFGVGIEGLGREIDPVARFGQMFESLARKWTVKDVIITPRCERTTREPGTADMSDVIERLNKLEREAGSRTVYYVGECCDEPCGECEGDDDDVNDCLDDDGECDDEIKLALGRNDWWEASDGTRWKVLYEDDDDTFLIARASGTSILQYWIEDDGVFHDSGKEIRLIREVDGPIREEEETKESECEDGGLALEVGHECFDERDERWRVVFDDGAETRPILAVRLDRIPISGWFNRDGSGGSFGRLVRRCPS